MLIRTTLSIIIVLLFLFPVSSEVSDTRLIDTDKVLKEIQQGNYAIIIGIDDYNSSDIIDLKYSEADALELYDVLIKSCKYNPDNVFLYLDGQNDPEFAEKASYEIIMKRLQSFSDSKQYSNKNTILFYFSGHGVNLNNRNCLIPCDGSSKSSENNIDLESDLLSTLYDCHFTKQIVIIDACKNKFDTTSKCFAKPFNEISIKYKYKTRLSVITSSKTGKYSWDEQDFKHNIFSYYLVQGLRGYAKENNGLITLDDLMGFVNSQMSKYSEVNPAQKQMCSQYGESHPETQIAIVKGDPLPPIQRPPANHPVFVKARLMKTLSGELDDIHAVAFSQDGKLLASASEDNTVRLWSVNSGECISTLSGHTDTVSDVAFSYDGQKLASASSDETIKLWSVDNGQEISTIKGHNDDVYCVTFSPDGLILASGSYDATIRFWSPDTGQEINILKGHKNGVCDIDFSPDSKTIASGSLDKTIKFWTVATGQEIRTIPCGHQLVFCVEFSSDGSTLASGHSDNTVNLWSVETGNEIISLIGHGSFVRTTIFSPDGRILASCSDDNTVKLWSMDTGEDLCTLDEHGSNVFSIDLSPDGRILASGSFDQTIKLWSIEYE